MPLFKLVYVVLECAGQTTLHQVGAKPRNGLTDIHVDFVGNAAQGLRQCLGRRTDEEQIRQPAARRLAACADGHRTDPVRARIDPEVCPGGMRPGLPVEPASIPRSQFHDRPLIAAQPCPHRLARPADDCLSTYDIQRTVHPSTSQRIWSHRGEWRRSPGAQLTRAVRDTLDWWTGKSLLPQRAEAGRTTETTC